MIKENLLKDYIQESIKKYWDLPVYTDLGKQTFLYKDVALKIARLHIMFEQNDIKEGDKIALWGKNSAQWAMTYLGIISYGAVVVPLLPDFHTNEIHNIINHSESVALFTSEALWKKIDEAEMPALRAIIQLEDNEILIERNKKKVLETYKKIDALFEEKYGKELKPESLVFPEIGNERLVALNYTSGSTGFSKGVMLSANSLAANILFAQNHMRLDPGDKIVSILPLAHTFGCTFDFLWPFTEGTQIHFLTRLMTPQILLSSYQEVKPNLILSVPLIIEKVYKGKILPQISKNPVKLMLKIPILNKLIYNKIKSSLTEAFGGNFREIVLGGAPLNEEVANFFRKMNFNQTIGYGMTECGPLISYENWDKTRKASSGKLVDTLELKIDSEKPYTIEGEIMVRGENVMQGYYKNEEATKQAIDSEGWLHTGDLGTTDADNFIYIKGRSKSLILGPSGENIYPEEIEAVINNKEYVDESLVVEREKRLVAMIHPDYELVKKNNISDEDLVSIYENLKKEVNAELPAFKRIARIEIFKEEFEKTPKQNIKRFIYT